MAIRRREQNTQDQPLTTSLFVATENTYNGKDDFSSTGKDVEEFEEDLESVEIETFSKAIVFSTDWTTETIINQMDKGNIELNPRFQRRDAWSQDRKSRFIESLFLGFPIPQIVLAERRDVKGKYLVLDGKQRLLTLRRFTAKSDNPDFEQLRLSGLSIRRDLNKLTYRDLQDSMFTDEVNAFDNTTIRTMIIKGWPNETFLYEVFLRLNTGSMQLSPQELRLALHPGPFMDFLDDYCEGSQALQYIFKEKIPDFRMRDCELLLRYLAFSFFINEYKGNLKKILDDTARVLTDEWTSIEPKVAEELKNMEEAHVAIQAVFKENTYKKWGGSKYESMFNRAVFDLMMYVFKHGNNRRALAENADSVEPLFKKLCTENKDFKSSIETTTKSITATYNRLHIWASALQKEFDGIEVEELRFNQ